MEVCKRYMAHEAEVLAEVTRLRSQADTARAAGDAVTLNNQRREQFPSNILAGMFGFGPRVLIEIEAAERANPDMKSLLSA